MKASIKIIAALFISQVSLFADFAPSSASSAAVHVSIASGTGYLYTSGESVLFTHPTEGTFALLGDGDTGDGYGVYSWQKTGPNTADLYFNDQLNAIVLTYHLVFTSHDGGTFSANDVVLGTQAGTFVWRHMLKHSEVATTLAAGKPVLRVDGGEAIMSFQMKSSTNLVDWAETAGSVSTDGSGRITFSTDADSSAKFYRMEILDVN